MPHSACLKICQTPWQAEIDVRVAFAESACEVQDAVAVARGNRSNCKELAAFVLDIVSVLEREAGKASHACSQTAICIVCTVQRILHNCCKSLDYCSRGTLRVVPGLT